MFGTLALVISLTIQQPAQGLFERTFLESTGRNGMEEYVRAFDSMQKTEWSSYAGWMTVEDRALAQGKRVSGRFVDTPAPLSPQAKRLEILSYLKVRQEEVRVFQRAWDLVGDGNEKPCYLPSTMLPSTFPIVSIGRSISKLGRDFAYVAASDGRSDLMVDYLTRVLTFLDNSCRSSFMAALVSVSNQAAVCGDFADNLDRISMQDAVRIEKATSSLLSERPSFLEAFDAAFRNDAANVDRAIRSAANLAGGSSKDRTEQRMVRVMHGMSSADVEQMIGRVQKSILDTGLQFTSRFSSPEETWLSIYANSQEPRDPEIENQADAEELWTSHWTPPFVTNPMTVARVLICRAKLRLLRLHSEVILFRWNHNRLPRNVEELALPEGYAFDPVSKKPFVYEVKGKNYRLYSLGAKETGPIDLGSPLPSASDDADTNP